MPRLLHEAGCRAGVATALLLGTLLALASSPARADPPIRSPEDLACRLEAKARVFSTPNPQGLEPEAIGRQIYYACMRRTATGAVRPARHTHRRRHHRRRHHR